MESLIRGHFGVEGVIRRYFRLKILIRGHFGVEGVIRGYFRLKILIRVNFGLEVLIIAQCGSGPKPGIYQSAKIGQIKRTR